MQIAIVLLLVLASLSVALLKGHLGSMGKPVVTVLDPRLRILWVQERKGGGTYYLPKDAKDVHGCAGHLGSRLEAELRLQLWKMGVKIRTLPSFIAGSGTNGRAFFVGYTLPIPPKSPRRLIAEAVAEDGTVYPLQGICGGGPPERSWNLWILDCMPAYVTNYTLCLKTETNGPLVGKIQFADP